MRASRVGIVGLVAAVGLGAGAPAAQAWIRTARAAGDPQTTYTVTSRTITIRSADPVLLEFVRNSQVLISCDAGKPGVGGGHGLGSWGAQASSITVHSRTRISRNLSVCNATEVGRVPGFLMAAQFSRAPFNAAWRKRLASTPPPGRLLARIQLFGVWSAIQAVLPSRFLNRYGILTRLPPPKSLVRIVHRQFSRAHAGLIYAPAVTGVTVPHVVYVIGAGSSRKRLKLAVIGFDGKRYTLRTTAGANSHPKFGGG